MPKPGLKTVASAVIEKPLRELEFHEAPPQTGFLAYERVHRGMKNRIQLERSRLGPGFRFHLYAPKWDPAGWTSDQLPGCPMWWSHETEEELRENMLKLKDALMQHGLPWLDTYTPGNVPDFRQPLAALIAPALVQSGFQRVESGLADLEEFVRESGRTVYVDFRVPGVVKAQFIVQMPPARPWEENWSPTFHYGEGISLEAAMVGISEYIGAYVRDWVRQ